MIYIKIEDGENVLYSDSPENMRGEEVLTLSKKVDTNKITVIATGKDRKILSSNRHSQTAFDICIKLADSIAKVKSTQSELYRIQSHNLITAHARLQDAVESIVPEESLASAEDHFAQISIAQQFIQKDTSRSADAFLNILKRVVDLQAQIEGFKILSGDRKLDIGDHNILKVLQNIIHPFYLELLSNHVNIRWQFDHDFAEINKIRTDYKVLNVILHHLLTNATKYTKPYSVIEIDFNIERSELTFSMRSVRIEWDELQRIFELGYTGKNVPVALAGEGVGMYMAQKACDLLGLKVLVEPDYSAHIDQTDDGTKYSPNKFILKGFQAAKMGFKK
mgnify:CR=1 FL=1